MSPSGSLRLRHDHTEENHDREDQQDEPNDLPDAPWPFAGDLARAAIHEDVEQPLLVTVVGHPDGQKQMFEGDREILRLLVGDSLVVAADVAVNEPDDLRLHHLLRFAEAFLQPDAVAFGFEAAEEIGVERFQLVEIPRRKIRHELFGYALGSAYEYVVEEVLHATGDGTPSRAGNGASLGDQVPLGIGRGVGLRVLVVVAAFASVARVRHGVVGPVRDVDAGKLPEVGGFLQLRRGEPEPAEPFVEATASRPQIEFERYERFGRDHAGSRFRPVLQMRAAERALLGHDLVFEQHHRSATGTPHL